MYAMEIPSNTEIYAAMPCLRSFGICLFDDVWRKRFHLNQHWEFHFIRHGRLELHFEKCRFQAGPGDLVIIPAETLHCDQFDGSNEFEVYMASFDWPQAAAAFYQAVKGPVINKLTATQRSELRLQLDLLYNDSQSETDYDQLLSQARFHAALLMVLKYLALNRSEPTNRAQQQRRLQRNQWLIQEAKNYIAKHYTRPLSLEMLAEFLEVSPFFLSRVFNSESGFSLSQYLTLQRMNQAKTLLLDGRMNVSEVADAVGYEDSGYFSKVFKRHFGCSPSSMSCKKPPRRR
jgi:AraC-like DNA-binding protein